LPHTQSAEEAENPEGHCCSDAAETVVREIVAEVIMHVCTAEKFLAGRIGLRSYDANTGVPLPTAGVFLDVRAFRG
jgi:hypothetical protein